MSALAAQLDERAIMPFDMILVTEAFEVSAN
jgi:hypothetical protein